MELGRTLVYAAGLIVLVAVAVGLFVAGRKWRFAIPVGVGCLLGALILGVSARSWVTERTLPGVVVYKGIGYTIGDGGQPGAHGPGMPVSCQGASALQHSGDWPLRQVGYVTWVSFSNVTANVGHFPRGYPVFVSPNFPSPAEVFVGVRPACFVGAVSF